MEMRKSDKTLAGLFLKYAAVFCISTVVLVLGSLGLLAGSSVLGLVLPANYAEQMLTEHAEQIRNSEGDIRGWVPNGCAYGIYDGSGAWILGDFSEEERETAWEYYGKSNIYAKGNCYYRFFVREDGTVCIVRYSLMMRYARERWNEGLPRPERLMLILDGILFLLNTFFLARTFAKKLQKELGRLKEITEKIADNDLEFEVGASGMKEINEVLASFGRMKDALGSSLQRQWDMEKEKQEQLAALTHDIKTPLTIIQGNAELLSEGLSEARFDMLIERPETVSSEEGKRAVKELEEIRECTDYIRVNADEIGKYLETMRQVIKGMEQEEEETLVGCEELEAAFLGLARQVSAAEKFPVSFDVGRDGASAQIRCRMGHMLRAWSNVISNAAEHTDRQRGFHIRIRQERRDGICYLASTVLDYGRGFLAQELGRADAEFYSGDASRHDRSHQGLGLAIAKRFLEEQGGFLEYGNACGAGAKVTLWIKIAKMRKQRQTK